MVQNSHRELRMTSLEETVRELKRFTLVLPAGKGQIAGGSADLCLLLEAIDLEGESPIMKVK